MSDTQVVSFYQTGRVFALLNSGLKPREVGFIGFNWTVPARDTIAYPHSKFADVPHSAKDADGDWIPGSIEISDGRIGGALDGQEERFFDAQLAVTHILGIREGQAMGHHAQAGLSLLPQKPTKAQIKQIDESGRKRYEASLMETAQAIVADHEARNEVRRRNSEPLMPAPPNVRRAMELMALALQEENKEMAKLLGRPEPAETSEAIDDEDLTLAIAIKAKALAVKYLPNGTPEQQEEFARDIATDPNTAEKIKRNLRPPKKLAAAGMPKVTVTPVPPQTMDASFTGVEPAGG